jgi:translation initiation factor 3 subunit C
VLTPYQDPEAFEREYTAQAAPQAPVRVEVVKKSVGVEGSDDDDDDFTHVGKGGKATQFTSEGIYKHLQAIHEARGKKVRTEIVVCVLTISSFFVFAEYRPC